MPPSIISTFSSPPGQFSSSLSAATILHTLLHPPTSPPLPPIHPILLSSLDIVPSSTARLFLAAALTLYKGVTYSDAKRKRHPAVEAAIREGLKLGTQNHYLDGIPLLFTAADLLKNPVQEGFKSTSSERVAIGLLLRNKSVHNPICGSHWAISLLFSLVQELVRLYDATSDTLNGKILRTCSYVGGPPSLFPSVVEEAARCIQVYNTFVSRVEELNLQACVDSKPVLDVRSYSLWLLLLFMSFIFAFIGTRCHHDT